MRGLEVVAMNYNQRITKTMSQRKLFVLIRIHLRFQSARHVGTLRSQNRVRRMHGKAETISS